LINCEQQQCGESRAERARPIARMIRESENYRWAGIYDVDMEAGLVTVLAY
jgi:hypothetical protein